MSDCIHCWHDTGNFLASNPPQFQLLCCHCGERQTISQKRMLSLRFDSFQPIQDSDRAEHGEFVNQIPLKNRYAKMVELQAAQVSEETKLPEPKLGELFQEWLKEHNAEIVVRVVTPLADAHCDPMNFVPNGWRIAYDAVPIKV